MWTARALLQSQDALPLLQGKFSLHRWAKLELPGLGKFERVWRNIIASGVVVPANPVKLISPDLMREGFQDFSPAGRRAIEPGDLALSLLYHGLANPLVILPAQANGQAASSVAYPTPDEL